MNNWVYLSSLQRQLLITLSKMVKDSGDASLPFLYYPLVAKIYTVDVPHFHARFRSFRQISAIDNVKSLNAPLFFVSIKNITRIFSNRFS